MVTECAAILAVTLCMMVVMVRSGHSDYSVSIAPLLLVPAVHLVAALVFARVPLPLGSMPYQMVIAFADIAALAVASLFLFAMAYKVKSTRNRRIYLVLLSGYNLILTCALISLRLAPILESFVENLEL